MPDDAGPWGRLIDEHRRNAVRLDAIRPAPPPSWGLPLGVVVPWLCFLVAVASTEPSVVGTAVGCSAALVPIGLACLFVPRLQTVTVGLVIGIGSSLFATGFFF